MVNDLRELLQSALKQQERAEASTPVRHHEEILSAHPARWEELYLLGRPRFNPGGSQKRSKSSDNSSKSARTIRTFTITLGSPIRLSANTSKRPAQFLEAIGLRNDFDRACLNLGRLKEEQGNLAEAELWYRRGAELKPGIRTHWLHLAGALGKQSKWAEAERVLRQTVDVDPENLDLQVNLAYALIQRERLEEAAAIYHRVLAQRPGYHEIHSNLAFVRERQGRFDEALSATRLDRVAPRLP